MSAALHARRVAHGVRRDLVEWGSGEEGGTHVVMAAEAASTLTWRLVLPGAVRQWMHCGRVGKMGGWGPGTR